MWLLVFSFVLFVTFFLVSFNLIIIRLAEPNQNKPKSKARNANDNRKRERERTITSNRIFLFMSYFIVISCSSNIPFDPHEFQMHVCGLIPEPIRWYVAAPILRKSPRLPLPQSIQLSSSPSSSIIIISPWFICRRLFFITCVYCAYNRMSFTIFSVSANSVRLHALTLKMSMSFFEFWMKIYRFVSSVKCNRFQPIFSPDWISMSAEYKIIVFVWFYFCISPRKRFSFKTPFQSDPIQKSNLLRQ